jgi:hypothetical protein
MPRTPTRPPSLLRSFGGRPPPFRGRKGAAPYIAAKLSAPAEASESEIFTSPS